MNQRIVVTLWAARSAARARSGRPSRRRRCRETGAGIRWRGCTDGGACHLYQSGSTCPGTARPGRPAAGTALWAATEHGVSELDQRQRTHRAEHDYQRGETYATRLVIKTGTLTLLQTLNTNAVQCSVFAARKADGFHKPFSARRGREEERGLPR